MRWSRRLAAPSSSTSLAAYGRLELRPPVLGDGPALIEMWDAEAQRWNGWTDELVRAYAAEVSDPARVGSGDDLVAYRASDGVVVGAVTLHLANWDAQRAAAGYRIAPQLRGQGYGTELVGLAATFAWRRGVQWLVAGTDRNNAAMRRVLERFGAVEVEAGPHTLPNGEVVDGCVYALALPVPPPSTLFRSRRAREQSS